MFRRLVHHQRHGKPVLNPDREAAANPKLFNGTWSPWQVLESDYLLQRASKNVPRPRHKCLKRLNYAKAEELKPNSKKSFIPEDSAPTTQTTSFLDDVREKVFKFSYREG